MNMFSKFEVKMLLNNKKTFLKLNNELVMEIKFKILFKIRD